MNDMKFESRVGIFRQNAGEIHHFFLGALAGIGEGMEVDHFHLHPAFHGEIGGDGAVDAPGEHHHAFAAGAHGETAGHGNGLTVNVNALFPHFNIDPFIGMAYIYGIFFPQPGQNHTADLLTQLRRGQREGLVTAAAFEFEGAALRQGVHKNGFRRFGDFREFAVSGALNDGAHGIKAEDRFEPFHRFFQIVVETHPQPSPGAEDFLIGESPTDVRLQLCDKLAFVLAF